MKYLGLDYGGKRVGIAVSDEAGSIAFPRETVPNDDKLISHLMKFIEAEKIESIVLGDTRALTGGENAITQESNSFADSLARETGKPVSRAREAWSSVEAARFAPKGKTHDDSSAAAIILQRFLDAQGKK